MLDNMRFASKHKTVLALKGATQELEDPQFDSAVAEIVALELDVTGALEHASQLRDQLQALVAASARMRDDLDDLAANYEESTAVAKPNLAWQQVRRWPAQAFLTTASPLLSALFGFV
jgi:hypothetical protein